LGQLRASFLRLSAIAEFEFDIKSYLKLSLPIETRMTLKSAVIRATGEALLDFPTILSAPVLAVGGFGATGVGAGTIAAAVQSSIGDVAAGSAFAILQSAGAGGTGLSFVNTVIQGVGVVIRAAGDILAERPSDPPSDPPSEPPSDDDEPPSKSESASRGPTNKAKKKQTNKT
jgi:hypothetical protein